MDAAFLAQCKAYRAQVKANVDRLGDVQAGFGELPYHLRQGRSVDSLLCDLEANQSTVLDALDVIIDDLESIIE